MTRDEIITAAEKFTAEGFVTLLEDRNISFAVIDQDNICDPNDGYLNLAVEGLDVGEALLFVDGEFSGL